MCEQSVNFNGNEIPDGHTRAKKKNSFERWLILICASFAAHLSSYRIHITYIDLNIGRERIDPAAELALHNEHRPTVDTVRPFQDAVEVDAVTVVLEHVDGEMLLHQH